MKNFFGVFFVLVFLLFFSFVGAYSYDSDFSEDEENDSLTFRVSYNEKTAQREFVIDVPHSVESGKFIPVLFEVRDAYGSDYWEYSFYWIDFFDGNDGNKFAKRFPCDELGLPIDSIKNSISYCTIDSWAWHNVEYLNPGWFKEVDGFINITAKYHGVDTLCLPSGCDTDAFPDNEPYPLIVEIDKNLPKIENWYCGDVHYHSSYTDTKFLASLAGEFGGPIDMAVSVLDALGLDWVTVTDHSNSFNGHKDDDLSWENFKEDCNNYDECLIGEEVNCRTSKSGEGVVSFGNSLPGNHFLAYDIDEGFLDNGYNDVPYCEEIVDEVYKQGGFGYVAHPESSIDYLGIADILMPWEDYSLPFSGLQIWNMDINNLEDGDTDNNTIPDGEERRFDLENGLEKWKELLLSGRKVYVSAGSDAHGDFQEFGKEYTCCYAEDYSKENIFDALENGNCYMGNNGAFVFGIDNLHGDVAMMGEEIGVLKDSDFEFNIILNLQEYCFAYFYEGIVGEGERMIYSEPADDYFSNVSVNLSELMKYVSSGVDFGVDSKRYYRFECVTEDGKKRIYTNPIWVYPVECFSDADCGDSLSTDSCENGEFCESNVSYFCRNAGAENSYCENKTIESCERCSFGCDDAEGVCVSGGLCAINSPKEEDVFSKRSVPFEIVGSEKLDRIEYIDNSASRARWIRLCWNCDEYVGDRFFSEGEHDVLVRCSSSAEEEGHSLNFFIDSRAPVILGVEPRGGFFDGDFSVRFREDNPSKVSLNYDGFIEEVDDCVEVGRNWECDVAVDLQEGLVEYWFAVEDVAGNIAESEKNNIIVDRTAPVVENLDSFWKEVGRWFSRYIDFSISITEENFDEVVVSYDYRGRATERRLCSSLKNSVCKSRFRIARGYSDIKIIVRDLAGNENSYDVDL